MHNLGIMGGSFDPIHYGHLKVAELAKVKFDLKKVIFVTAYCPPHKSTKELTTFEHRHEMVNLAIKDYPFFKSSKIEMERGGISYAGDTIEAFKKKYRNHWQIFFLTGLDVLLNIINWDNTKIYPGLCKFIAATRPGYDKESIEKKLPNSFRNYITILEDPSLAISSTEIRERVGSNKSIHNLVPESVVSYIIKFSLYKSKIRSDT